MYLIFDTETTGVPKNYKGDLKDSDNWPRVIQLAYALFDENGNCILKAVDLIRPDNWIIPNEKFWIDNGFSTQHNLKNGIPFVESASGFISALSMCNYLISHNMQFDYPIMIAEFYRYGLKSKNKPNRICTMTSTTSFCQLPGKRGFKWPKLEELHIKLFKTGFDGAHDAMNDVLACARCFFEAKKRGIITL